MMVTVPSAGSEFTMVRGMRSLCSPFRMTRNCPAFRLRAIRGASIFWKKTFWAISLLSVSVNNGGPPNPPTHGRTIETNSGLGGTFTGLKTLRYYFFPPPKSRRKNRTDVPPEKVEPRSGLRGDDRRGASAFQPLRPGKTGSKTENLPRLHLVRLHAHPTVRYVQGSEIFRKHLFLFLRATPHIHQEVDLPQEAASGEIPFDERFPPFALRPGDLRESVSGDIGEDEPPFDLEEDDPARPAGRPSHPGKPSVPHQGVQQRRFPHVGPARKSRLGEQDLRPSLACRIEHEETGRNGHGFSPLLLENRLDGLFERFLRETADRKG